MPSSFPLADHDVPARITDHLFLSCKIACISESTSYVSLTCIANRKYKMISCFILLGGFRIGRRSVNSPFSRPLCLSQYHYQSTAHLFLSCTNACIIIISTIFFFLRVGGGGNLVRVYTFDDSGQGLPSYTSDSQN